MAVIPTALILNLAVFFHFGLCVGADSAKVQLPIVLQRADVLRNRTMDNETVKELIGNVYITRGDMGIKCQHAYHYQQAGRIIFTREVHYSDSLRNLFADKAIYFIANDSLEAVGSVKIYQDHYEAYAAKVNYSEERKNVFLKRDVKLVELDNAIDLSGNDGFGDDSLKYARVIGAKARLVQYDSTGGELSTIFALKIEYFDTAQQAVATDSVEIYREDIYGECGILTYFLEESKALMELNPVLLRDRDELKGDTVYLYFVDEKIDHIEIFGNASVISPVEGGKANEFHKMFGKQMFVKVAEDKIREIVVVGNARSLYYIYEETKEGEKEYKGANSASGDRIYLHFAEGKLKTIDVAGGTEGVYYPSDYPGEIE